MRFRVDHLLVAAMLVLFLPLSARATDQMNHEQIVSIGQLQTKLSVLQELTERKFITEKEADTANTFYCDRAAQILGHSITTQEVNELASSAPRTEGFRLFLNSVIVLAGITLLLAAVGLIAFYLSDFLKSLPAIFYELCAYFATAGLLLCAYFAKPFEFWSIRFQPLWMIVPAALAFCGCIILTHWLHWPKGKVPATTDKSDHVYAGPGLFSFPTVLSGLCAVVWSGIAICFHQAFPASGIPHFVAFIAVIAWQSFPRVLFRDSSWMHYFGMAKK